MSDVIGRAGFHVQHTKAPAERAPILHEAMRSIIPGAVEYWAARNPNIVIADQHLDQQYVNDGQGGFIRCTDRQQVIAYGESRLDPERLSRQMSVDAEVTTGARKGRKRGGTLTTSLFVLHLPKSMCREVPNFYPRFHKDGSPMLDPATGEQMRRSRWVAKDPEQARRFFEDEIDYLAAEVVPGGRDAILGYSIQHSESTPHIQIIADTLAPDPKKEGKLRWDAARAYFVSRDIMVPVLDDDGEPVMRTDKDGNVMVDADGNPEPKKRLLTGEEKLAAYHEGLKAHLVELGYDISPDFDEERHLIGMSKQDYVKAQDARAEAVAHTAHVEGLLADKGKELESRLASVARAEAEWSAGNPEQGVAPGPRYAAAQARARAEAKAEVERVTREAEEKTRRAEEAQRAAEAAQVDVETRAAQVVARERKADEREKANAEAEAELKTEQEQLRQGAVALAHKADALKDLMRQVSRLAVDGQSAPEAFDAGVTAALDAIRGTTTGSALSKLDLDLAKDAVRAKRPKAVGIERAHDVSRRVAALAAQIEEADVDRASGDLGEE